MAIWRDLTTPEYEEDGVYEIFIDDNHSLRIDYQRRLRGMWTASKTLGWSWKLNGPVYNFQGFIPGDLPVEEAQKASFSAVKEILMNCLDLIERTSIPETERIIRGED